MNKPLIDIAQYLREEENRTGVEFMPKDIELGCLISFRGEVMTYKGDMSIFVHRDESEIIGLLDTTSILKYIGFILENSLFQDYAINMTLDAPSKIRFEIIYMLEDGSDFTDYFWIENKPLALYNEQEGKSLLATLLNIQKNLSIQKNLL